jgi:hypothetical protein
VPLHVSAIIFYLVAKRDNLVGPMVTGSNRWTASSPPPSPGGVPVWRIIAGIVPAAGIAWWVSLGCRFEARAPPLPQLGDRTGTREAQIERLDQIRSITIAMPWPTPMHIAQSA